MSSRSKVVPVVARASRRSSGATSSSNSNTDLANSSAMGSNSTASSSPLPVTQSTHSATHSAAATGASRIAAGTEPAIGALGSRRSSSSSEAEGALEELLRLGDINAEQFETTRKMIREQVRGENGGTALDRTLAPHTTNQGAIERWLEKRFIPPQERRRLERILAITRTVDFFQAMRFLRQANGHVKDACSMLIQATRWRNDVMAPLMQNPAPIVNQLSTGRFWLLPVTTKDGHPIVVLNTCKCGPRTRDSEEELENAINAGLYVLEKAVGCSDDPLVKVTIIVSRFQESEHNKDPVFRGRFVQALTDYFPLRIDRVYVHSPQKTSGDVLLSVVARAVVHKALGRRFPPVHLVHGQQLRQVVDSTQLPKALGGASPYEYVLSDIMMPPLRLKNFGSSMMQLRFQDKDLEQRFARWYSRTHAPQRSIGLWVTLAIVLATLPSTTTIDPTAAIHSPAYLYAPVLMLWLCMIFAWENHHALRDQYFTGFLVLVCVLVLLPGILLPFTCKYHGWQGGCNSDHEHDQLIRFALMTLIASVGLNSRGYSLLISSFIAWLSWAICAVVQRYVEEADGYWWSHFACAPLVTVPAFLLCRQREFLARNSFRSETTLNGKWVLLQEELSGLRAQTRNTPMLALDHAFHITIWNGALRELTGWRGAQVIGKDIRAFVVAAERDITVRRLRSVFTSKQSVVETFELNILKNTNSATLAQMKQRGQMLESVVILCDATPKKDLSGKTQGIVVLGHDITERVRLEEARKGFVASFSHELRTPLSGIMGMLELLSEHKGVDQIGKRYVEKARVSSSLLLNLINDILDMSRIETGNMQLRNSSFDVRKTVASVTELVKQQAELKGLQLSHSVDDLVPTVVRGDVLRFAQVLINLLSNAVKFTIRGSVSVTITSEYASKAKGVILCGQVRDTGIGIEEAQVPRLFEMFAKAHQSDSRVANASGCGLGLAISSKLLNMMNGSISCRSVVGKGSTFTFSLLCGMSDSKSRSNPTSRADSSGETVSVSKESKVGSLKSTASDEEDNPLESMFGGRSTTVSKDQRDEEQQAVVLRGKRVLFAEDNAFNAEVLQTFMEQAGLHVTWASNGRQTCEHYFNAFGTEKQYHVVLMDCQMPVMNGWEATQQIRKWENDNGHTRSKIIALTAFAMAVERTKCLDAGMDAVVTKPVTKRILMRSLRRHLGGENVESPVVPKRTLRAEPRPTGEAGDRLQGDEIADIITHGGSAITASLNAQTWTYHSSLGSTNPPNAQKSDVSFPVTAMDNDFGGAKKAREISKVATLPSVGESSGPPLSAITVHADADTFADNGGAEYLHQPIDEALGMSQFGGSKTVYSRMMSKFALEYLPRSMKALRVAFEAWDHLALRMEAHSLRGSTAFVGATNLSDICGRLMSVCGLEGELAPWQQKFIRELMAQLNSEFEILNVYFQSKHHFTLTGAISPGSPPADTEGGDLGDGGEGALRILFAEDNDFTVEILKCLVKGVGVDATWVADGRSVIDTYIGSPDSFDVILMDCQMPIMNGDAATREIRTWEANQPGRFSTASIIAVARQYAPGGKTKPPLAGFVVEGEGQDVVPQSPHTGETNSSAGSNTSLDKVQAEIANSPSTQYRATPLSGATRHIPIIGFSACGMHQQQCEAAGMDAFVVKPIERAQLTRLISKIALATRKAAVAAGFALPACAGEAKQAKQGGASVSPGAAHPHTSSIDEVRGVNEFESRELYSKCLRRFVDVEIAARREAMLRTLAQQSWPELFSEVHSLKSSAGVVFATKLHLVMVRLQETIGHLRDGGTATSDVQQQASALVREAVAECDDILQFYTQDRSNQGPTAANVQTPVAQTALIQMSPNELAERVVQLGSAYEPYREIFVDNGVDGASFVKMNTELLKSIGISNAFHVMKILDLRGKL